MGIYKRVLIVGVIFVGLGGVLGSPAYAKESPVKPGTYEYYDMDGDGHKDRLSVEVDESGRLMTYLGRNNGRGSYASTELLIVLEEIPVNIFILDFDKDGDLDLLFTYPIGDIYHDSGNYLARNNGKGHFDMVDHLPRDY